MQVTIIGGGGFRVPLVHRALLRSGLPVQRIVLHDVSADRLDVMARVLAESPVPVERATDLDDALRGSEVVFCAVRVGGLDGRVRDERGALELGLIGQETVGAGGLLYAARSVPWADAVAARIAAVAPHAWTITMTNPAGIVTEAMAAVLGERVVGVCDSPAGLVGRACRALGVTDADVDYLGLNHLGWLRALVVDGADRLPELLANDALLAGIEEGRLFGADLVRALGALPNEYLYWYYAPREALDALRRAPLRGERVRDEQRAFYAAARTGDAQALWVAANDERNRSYLAELRNGERDDVDIAAGGYEGVAVALARALTTGAPARLILNVRNGATVSALDGTAVIETVCDVDADGARPRPVAPPTAHQLGLIATVKSCEQAIITAARTGDADAALHAFATHPLVDSLDAARVLARRALAQRPLCTSLL